MQDLDEDTKLRNHLLELLYEKLSIVLSDINSLEESIACLEDCFPRDVMHREKISVDEHHFIFYQTIDLIQLYKIDEQAISFSLTPPMATLSIKKQIKQLKQLIEYLPSIKNEN